MASETDQTGVDHYAVLCSAMRPGLLVTVNGSGGATSAPSDEFTVTSSDDDGTVYLEDHIDRTWRLRHDSPQGTVLEKVDSDGFGGRERVVETIEVIGVDA